MPRRAKVERRPVPPDPRFHSRTVGRFVNKLMTRGKKSTAERIFYNTMDIIEGQTKRPPQERLNDVDGLQPIDSHAARTSKQHPRIEPHLATVDAVAGEGPRQHADTGRK
jgi:ribosomal protein S7